MTKESIINELVTAVQDRIGEGRKVGHREVKKNNGVVLDGITIELPTPEGCGAVGLSVTFYINEFLPDLLAGDAYIYDVADIIVKRDAEADHDRMTGDLEGKPFTTPEFVLDNVHRCLINTEKNKELLENAFSKQFNDLSIVYRVFLGGGASFLLTNNAVEAIGVAEDEIDARARANDKWFWTHDGMTSLLLQMVPQIPGFDASDIPLVDDVMIVASNRDKLYGAAVMTDGEYLSKIVRGDSYIFPSSVHECIIVPTSQGDINDFRDMVHDVNRTAVEESDILSDNVYFFNAATKQVSIA